MRVTIHTDKGTFIGKHSPDMPTERQIQEAKDALQAAADNASYFSLLTDEGIVVLGGDLLKTAGFVLGE